MKDTASHWDRYFVGPGLMLTPVVKVMIIASVCSFIATAFLPFKAALISRFAFTPGVFLKEYAFWQVLTFPFINTDFWVLLFNMLALWLFGSEVENAVGTRKFAALSTYSAILGALVFSLLSPPFMFLQSASVIIFAVIGVYALLFPDRTITLILFFVLPVEMKAKYFLMLLGLIELVLAASASQSGAPGWFGANLSVLCFTAALFRFFGSRWLEMPAGFPGRAFLASAKTPSASDSAVFINEKVDPILDKISRRGMDSLSRTERLTLKKARAILEARADGKKHH